MGDGQNVIHTQTCNVCRESINKQLSTSEIRLNAHSEELDDLKQIVIKLTQLQEIQTQAVENQTRTLNAMERRVRELELLAQRNVDKPSTFKAFIMSSAGQWTIKVGVIIILLVVLAALGKTVDQGIVLKFLGIGG